MFSQLKFLLAASVIVVIAQTFLVIKIKVTQAHLATAQEKIINLQNDIQMQNVYFDKLKAAGDAQQAELNKKEQEAALFIKTGETRIDAVLNTKVNNNCQEAIKWGAITGVKLKPLY
jgi:hypothetical protein